MTGFDNPRQHWDARFSGEDYYFGRAPNRFLAEHRDLLPKSLDWKSVDHDQRMPHRVRNAFPTLRRVHPAHC